MKIITSLQKMQQTSRALHRQGKVIGFVPTMGALHEGHLSLVRMARQKSDVVAVSIFVNPAQFGPNEDFQRYPRNLKRDSALLREEKCDLLFFPSRRLVYPEGYLTYVDVEDLSDKLEGGFRPGHFHGVATVLTKLFNLVQPDLAFFGQKDAQQAVIIRKMVSDLDFPTKIVVGSTVRDEKGLALSSRNGYLKKDERPQALCLYEALQKGKELINQGEKNPQAITASMQEIIRKYHLARTDYIAVTDTVNLEPLDKIAGEVLISLAVRIGGIRLIDNLCLRTGKKVRQVTC
jgi:pantoate--beta-alanine ligase